MPGGRPPDSGGADRRGNDIHEGGIIGEAALVGRYQCREEGAAQSQGVIQDGGFLTGILGGTGIGGSITKIGTGTLTLANGNPNIPFREPDVAVAYSKAWNDFCSEEFQKVSPRLKCVALVSFQDVPEAVKELRRAVKELKLVGLMLPAATSGSSCSKLSISRSSARSRRCW